jgi:NAD(P)-dependent dehydrogenase (short-subunit alcohol dehydrogenase family)
VLKDKQRLQGKNIVITGGNAGIGLEAAKAFSRMGAQNIIIAARNEESGKEAVEIIRKEGRGKVKVEYMKLDLASLDSVRQTGEKLQQRNMPIHILVNNAGAVYQPNTMTNDKLEAMFQVNHLSHFLLTNMLYDNLKQNDARVVNVSSMMHAWFKKAPMLDEVSTDPTKLGNDGYAHSKLCNVLFTKGLQQHFEKDKSNAVSVCLHPGLVASGFGAGQYPNVVRIVIDYFVKPLFAKTPEQGAQTIIYCAVAPVEPGAYYADCAKAKESEQSKNQENIDKLWAISEKYSKLTK